MHIACKPALFLFLAALLAQQPAQELTKQQEQAAAQAVAILDEAVRGIPEIQEPGPRIRAAMSAAQTYARAGRREQAILTVNQLLDSFPAPDNGTFDPHRDRALVEAVGILCNMRAPEAAEPLAASIQQGSRWYALSRVAGAYAYAGDHTAAQRTIAVIPEGRSRDSGLQMVAHACISKRDFACASASAETIADPAMKAQVLAYLATRKIQQGATASAVGDVAQAKALAEGLPDSGEARSTNHHPGCAPDTRPTPRDAALHKVAESQTALGDYQAVRETLASIQDQHVRENALVMFSTALAFRRDFNGALAVAGEIARPQCRSAALSSLAYYQYRAGDVQGAQNTMSGIPSASDRVFALLNISRAQERRGNEDVAPTLALAVDLAIQVPDPLERLFALLQVAHRQTALGLADQLPRTLRAARDLAGQPPPPPSQATGWNWNSLMVSVAELLAESGDLEGAAEVARNAQHEFADSAVARGAARGGHLAAARAWIDSLPQPSRSFALIGTATGILDLARIGRSPASSW